MTDTPRASAPGTFPATGKAQPDRGPVIVLSFPFAGAELLTDILSGNSSLACTSSTGLIPLCHTALASWEQVDHRSGLPSRLAIKSVRALLDAMVTVIQVRTGAARWCETAFAQPAFVNSFLHIFPSAEFLCVYRNFDDFLKAGLRAYPWGLGESPFWSHSAGHPGNNVATIAACWTDWAGSLLDFEANHASSCLRVRREDLIADTDTVAMRIFSHLGFGAVEKPSVHARSGAFGESDAASAAGSTADDGAVSDAEPSASAKRIPPELLRRLNRISTELGYVELRH